MDKKEAKTPRRLNRDARAALQKQLVGDSNESDATILRALATNGILDQLKLREVAAIASKTTLYKSIGRLTARLLLHPEPSRTGSRGRPVLHYSLTNHGLIFILSHTTELQKGEGLARVVAANPELLPEILSAWNQLTLEERLLLSEALMTCLPSAGDWAWAEGTEVEATLELGNSRTGAPASRDTSSGFFEARRKQAENMWFNVPMDSARMRLLRGVLGWMLNYDGSHFRGIRSTMPPAVSELDRAKLKVWVSLVSKMARGSEITRSAIENEIERHSRYHDYYARLAE